jgi:hypothetical protein
LPLQSFRASSAPGDARGLLLPAGVTASAPTAQPGRASLDAGRTKKRENA